MATFNSVSHPHGHSSLATRWSRRDLLKWSALGLGLSGASLSGWLPQLARAAADDPGRKRSCILLWMPGGPTQTDTFDMKPGHANAGEFKPIDTSVAGIQISEHLPTLAKQMEHMAIVRSMQTKEGDHGRATYHLRTGYRPQGPVQYPTLGAVFSQELGVAGAELPNYVSIMPNRFLSPAAFGPGFLGPRFAPLVVGGENNFAPVANTPMTEAGFGPPLEIRNVKLTTGIDESRAAARLGLLQGLEDDFRASHPGLGAESHKAAYEQAVRMMRSESMQAFDLEQEPVELRERYGKNRFGQGCLLARRLVERGVPFVEVSLSGVNGGAIGWDTHADNFNMVKGLSGVLDPAWGTLLDDLKQRGLLESTLVVWMGEFGRTPVINGNKGRDHFPNAWSTVLCGGGIRGGQAYGATSEGGDTVKENPVTVPDLIATISSALGLDPTKQNMSNIGRPIPIADHGAKVVEALVRA